MYLNLECLLMLMGGILYVGGDESNHAGDTEEEFIVAPFSFKHVDSIVKKFPNRRDIIEANKWIKEGGDYRFTVCAGKIYRSSQNLPKVIPTLINSYITQANLDVETLKIYLDGRLGGRAKKKMREELMEIHGIEKVVIDNFTKKRVVNNRLIKGYYCPRLVWLADTLANGLYRDSKYLSDFLNHEKMVEFSKL